ncbi:outer membrane lipoprotein-sorting protein [Vibrio sonorensis]|uniref:outer membrane lipoprotein-sorting protein n=1 Tax=Vibrio sonorensis TaxID=1004316 RepID=UPI0008DAA180|nr:outer membrane lipoprotein-sorting protein [Vibrio sonorensis]
MFKTLLIWAASATLSFAYAANVEQMLFNADQFRLGEDTAKVVSTVKLFENGELEKSNEYHVYTRENRESLVLFKSKTEAGQKMLMLGDNYWLVMPKSRRPIRITPMQKLLGEASVGDISTLTWSEDYNGTFIAETAISVGSQTVLTNQLELKAKTSGASYQTITLWLDRNNDFPVKADLYLRSGKLAKQAVFTSGLRNNQTHVIAMTLLDQIQPAKKTVIEYQSVEAYKLDDKFYNPSYLTRNSELGL